MKKEISFGVWLYKQRRSLDLTRRAFASQAGCAEVTLRRIENGTLKPSKELARILLEKIGIPENDRPQWIQFARGLTGHPEHPLDSSPAKPLTNLPSLLTTFIGRGKEKAEIIQHLSKCRLVTLTGSGGVGKTRLAIEVGEQVLGDYSNGTWLADLAPLNEPAFLVQTVAALFGLAPQPNTPPVETLINFLRAKTVLLILDNCEHILEACAQLTDKLLKSCPSLKILATSREALGIMGEFSYHVPSLGLPDAQRLPANVRTYESVRLFEERAQLARSDFVLTAENESAVAQTCSRLDGIPLAIELAAARVSILQVEEILKQLQDSFALLSTNNYATSSRHQTLQASLDWSWGLLSGAEQTFMRQLSVFAGGWTLESAQAVCDGEALELTSSLGKKSLLVVNQETGRATRYRFHEAVRQYTREKLVQSDEEEKIRTRHLVYFLGLSEQAETALRGPAQVEWMRRLEDELDNIRGALDWANKNHDVEAGLFIFGRLGRFWYSDLLEGQRWGTEFIQKMESNAFPHARIKALNTYGHIVEGMEQAELARSTGEECLALSRVFGDQKGEVDALLLLGFLGGKTNGELLQQALVLCKTLGDVRRQADVLLLLGWDHSDPQRARAYWEEAVSLFRQAEDWGALVDGLDTLGWYIMLNGDVETAQKLFDEAFTLNQRFKNRTRSGSALMAYGRIALMRGDFEQARALLQEAITSAEASGSRQPYNWFRTFLGHIALREGNLTEAYQILSESAQSFQKNRNSSGVVFALEGIAGLYIATGKLENGARLIGWSDARREEIGDPRTLLEQVAVDRDTAACRAQMGEAEFSDVYDEGRTITLDEAVAYALGKN
jgi:predicted ATPase/DNA-binding XRE family transcriptional regulator